MKFPKDTNGGSQEKLYSIQCWLSNGQSSPEFRTKREDLNFVLKKVNFDEDKPIRSISAIQDATFTGNFTFYDGLGKVVRKIESSEEQYVMSQVEIAEDEDIIGVYGKTSK